MIVIHSTQPSCAWNYCKKISEYIPPGESEREGALTNGHIIKILRDDLELQRERKERILDTIRQAGMPPEINGDNSPHYEDIKKINFPICCFLKTATVPVVIYFAVAPLAATISGAVALVSACGSGAGIACAIVAMNVGGGVASIFLSLYAGSCAAHCAEGILIVMCKNDYAMTVGKIQGLINHLQMLPPSDPLPIEDFCGHLGNTPLTKKTRYGMICRMSLNQLMDLRQRMGKAAFQEFSNQFLLPTTINALNSLELILSRDDKEKDKEPSMLALSSFLKTDEELWKCIVRGIPEDQWSKANIQRILIEARISRGEHEDEVKKKMYALRLHVDKRVAFNVSVNSVRKQPLTVPLAPLLAHTYFQSLFLGTFQEAKTQSVDLELELLEYEALPSFIKYMETRSFDSDHVFGLLMLANRFQVNEVHAACYAYISWMIANNTIAPAEFAVFLKHSPNMGPQNETLLNSALNHAMQNSTCARTKELLNLAKKFGMNNVFATFEAGLPDTRPRWMFENEWLSLAFQYDLSKLQQQALGTILGAIDATVGDLRYLQLCKNIPVLLDAARKKYAQAINSHNFQALVKYADKDNVIVLKVALVQYQCRDLNPGNVSRAWSYAQQTHDSDVTGACLQCFQQGMNATNFHAIWDCAVKSRDNALKHICKEYLKTHIEDDNFRFIWEFAERERCKDIKDALKEDLRKHQNKSALACQWNTDELPKDLLELLK